MSGGASALAAGNGRRRDVIVLHGIVCAEHRGDLFEVHCTMGAATWMVLARRSGKMNKSRIHLVVGDAVEVEVSGYDPRRGRIVWRGTRKRAA